MRNTEDKLFDLLCESEYMDWDRKIEYLITNGVTVQEGEPLEVFLHPIDAYKGLKAKYLVFKADTGGKSGELLYSSPCQRLCSSKSVKSLRQCY